MTEPPSDSSPPTLLAAAVTPMTPGGSAVDLDAVAPMTRFLESHGVDGVLPPKSAAGCDAKAIERNLAFSQKHRINGTPALVFEDGVRVPGAMPAAELDKRLVEARRPKG